MSSNQPLRGYTVVEIGHGGRARCGRNQDRAGRKRRLCACLGPPFRNDAAPHFVAMNRNKRSAVVDLADDAQSAALKKLMQVIGNAQTRALGIVQQGPEGALPTGGLPLRFDGMRPDYRTAAPALGVHTAEVMSKR